MSRKYLIPLALILILALAACAPQQTAATNASAAAAEDDMSAMPETSSDTVAESASDSMDDSQDNMADMADTSDAMDGNQEDMSDTGGTMDDSHDDMATTSDTMDSNHDDMTEMDADSSAAMDDTMGEAGNSDDRAGSDEDMADASAAMMDLPIWQTLPLTDAATGESFALADFQGKTVFVEPMATWCSNCRTQQGNVVQAKLQLSDDDVVFVGLSLETTLPAEDLARYARDNGFHWTYAVMSEELLAGLASEFGRSITSAPSTPHFIIRPDGSFTELSTGIDSPAEIVAKIQEAQS